MWVSAHERIAVNYALILFAVNCTSIRPCYHEDGAHTPTPYAYDAHILHVEHRGAESLPSTNNGVSAVDVTAVENTQESVYVPATQVFCGIVGVAVFVKKNTGTGFAVVAVVSHCWVP